MQAMKQDDEYDHAPRQVLVKPSFLTNSHVICYSTFVDRTKKRVASDDYAVISVYRQANVKRLGNTLGDADVDARRCSFNAMKPGGTVQGQVAPQYVPAMFFLSEKQ